jgi:tetrahydromethanopterin S-methyltransferase subunit A
MSPSWPVVDGEYVVGDPDAPVAVCTLTSEKLVDRLAQVADVAIAGQVFTANLGIERIVTNVTANPAIRFLLLCGKDSRLFRPGQSLSALVDNGADEQSRIIGSEGYEPVVASLSASQIEQFRRQIELVDRSGESDPQVLAADIATLTARNPGRFDDSSLAVQATPLGSQRFTPIRPGGKREPLQYDPKGYFVIRLDRGEGEIVIRHYLPDHSPAHEMRGRLAGSMLLGLLREGLISQLSHAGYLGEELAKAQAALSLGLRYEQDRPLRRPPRTPGAGSNSTEDQGNSAIAPPLTRDELVRAADNDVVKVTVIITDQLGESEFKAAFLEPLARDPFRHYTRTDLSLTFTTSAGMRTAMGSPADIVPGAIVRVTGPLRKPDHITAEVVVVLNMVAHIE